MPRTPGDNGPDVDNRVVLNDVVYIVEVDRCGGVARDQLHRVAALERASVVDVEQRVLLGEVAGLIEGYSTILGSTKSIPMDLRPESSTMVLPCWITTVPSTVRAREKPGTRPPWKLSMKT